MKSTSGYDALWLWFGLSRASFLVLPRVMMHEMPDKWQADMARLLKEYGETFPNQPDIGTRVQCTTLGGKLRAWPEWLLNYRRPDYAVIDQCRPSGGQSAEETVPTPSTSARVEPEAVANGH